MKVLFVSELQGGHATVHHHLFAVLDREPDVSYEMLHVPPARLGRRIVGAQVPGLARLDVDLQPLRAQLAASAWTARRLRRAAADADVVHVDSPNVVLLSASTLARVPSVVNIDTTNTHNAYRLPYRTPTRFTRLTVAATKPFERRVYDAATTVVANSRWAAASLGDDYGMSPARVRVIPFGIVPPRVEPAAAPGTTASRPVIVFVGRQLVRKGGRRLLELHQRHLRDRADLLLVTHEPVAPAPGVRVVGDLQPGTDHLWSLLRRSAIFAFPSEIDQAPNAVLEAMAAGLPVVANDTAAVPEMVDHGRTGLLVPNGDDGALLGALSTLLDDPARRSAMGAAGRARVMEHYDAATCAGELVAVLRAACDQDQRRTGDRS